MVPAEVSRPVHADDNNSSPSHASQRISVTEMWRRTLADMAITVGREVGGPRVITILDNETTRISVVTHTAPCYSVEFKVLVVFLSVGDEILLPDAIREVRISTIDPDAVPGRDSHAMQPQRVQTEGVLV